MESAAYICQSCGEPILAGTDAAACPHCCALLHQSCFQNAGHACPACGSVCENLVEPAAGAASQHTFEFPEGEFQRLKPSALYRFSLVAVSLAMVLVPVLYVGLIGLFIWGVIAFATHFDGLLALTSYGLVGILLIFLFYFGPIFIGVMLTFFLVKPLFAPRRADEQAFSLNHADAPQLFALVGWICRSLEAPIPSRIDVDCRVNAGAGFRSGWRSLFGNDMILVIGLPLVAGMDLAQLAGIIAHEYGHFSQGSAMRASWLMSQINNWFFRVVYERDQWDEALEQASERENGKLLLVIPLYMARFAIWLTRGLLWVLMAISNALSCFMERQKEFDADRYEVRLCGSEHFPVTMRRGRQLDLGFNVAIRQIREKWKKERKLFDQIPEFIVSRADEITAEKQERLHSTLSRRRTRLFDAHPSDAERVQHALATREPGIFHSTAPATSLFTDFPELSRRVTMAYYQSVFGREIPPERLISTQQLKTRAEHDYAADRALVQNYFLGIAAESRPVIISENKSMLVRRPENILAELHASRRRMEELLPEAKTAYAEFLNWEARLQQAEQAAQLLAAGFQFDPTNFGLADNDADRAVAEAREHLQAAETALIPFETAGRTRLMNAVQSLRLSQFSGQIPDAEKLQKEAAEMVFVLSRLGEVFALLLELRNLSATLELLLAFRREQPAADNVTSVLENLCTEIQERVNAIQEGTASIRYPFHHATEHVMVSEYARNKAYHSDPFELALREGKSQSEKLLDLYVRVLGRLVGIGEEVEGVAN